MEYSREFLRTLYHDLLCLRMAEEKLVEMYALGKIPGHIHSGVGEEAAFVGTLATKNDGDYYKGTHRVVSAVNLMGISLEQIFAEIYGKETGTSQGRGGVNHIGTLDNNILGTAGSLGCDMVVATGAALSAQYLGDGKITYAYYGDGTSSRGSLHEAFNLAAMWKLPILFICTNNEFAISAHVSTTVPVPNPGADRAAAYGMPGRVVNGNDVLAVYEAAKELAEHVRAGNGPAILETKCYRRRGHFEGDVAKYRDAEVARERMEDDCVANMEKYILEKGAMTSADFEQARVKLAAELDAAVSFAENSPGPDPQKIFAGLYA